MRVKAIISGLLSLLVILTGVVGLFLWTFCRIDVDPDQCLVLVAKTGDSLPAGQKIAEPGQRGIQREALGPGRYFKLPWLWEWELEPVTTISAGDPATWREVYREGNPDYSVPEMVGAWPQVGVVTSLAGKKWDGDGEVVPPGFQGVQRAVLTPGTYRINPRAYKVELVDAQVIPLGCVGVVTSQLGEDPGTEVITETSIGPDGEVIEGPQKIVQKLAQEGQRGVLENVLQPGLYYLNPKVHKVKIVQVGYNQLSQLQADPVVDEITFPSADGFTIAVEVTVVWGRHPQNTPEMINRLGEVSRIKEIILGQTRSICRNIGSQYNSVDFIEGEQREQYQRDVTATLRRVCEERNIEILIALIQNIEVRGDKSGSGDDLDLKQSIQAGYIAQEENLTTQKRQETARVNAELEAALIAIEVAREDISSDTRKKVAQIHAEGEKTAQEIDAQRNLEVAQIDRKIAELDAERTRVLGQADATVTKLKQEAEAEGKRLFVEAFGTGRAYNLYTFAQQFEPDSVRLIFAGEGTFWTDLTRVQDAAALELLRGQQDRRNQAPE